MDKDSEVRRKLQYTILAEPEPDRCIQKLTANYDDFCSGAKFTSTRYIEKLAAMPANYDEFCTCAKFTSTGDDILLTACIIDVQMRLLNRHSFVQGKSCDVKKSAKSRKHH